MPLGWLLIHQRIWFALTSKVQESDFHHSKSPALALYKALKTQYEQLGTSAEFYARQNYENERLSDHESVTNFLTALTNLAHLVNKELSGIAGRIEDQTIAMRTIHSFPPACTPSKRS